MADFTGFYFDNIHSSTYGLIRTSNGTRYSEGLVPDFEDYSIERVGGDGDLYEGRRYKKTKFEIPVAFDHITEKQLREMRQWLGTDKLKEFRFDERPYKAYWVKLASSPKLDYVCFLEPKEDAINSDDKERIYKGEGTLEFLAYDPFGYCNDNSWKLTPEGKKPSELIKNGINWQKINETYVPFTVLDLNVEEWGEVSGLKNDLRDYNHFTSQTNSIDSLTTYSAYLYNPGDFNAEFQLLLSLGGSKEDVFTTDEEVSIEISQYEKSQFFKFTLKGINENSRILINSKNHSLAVYDDGKKSLRYDLVKSTDWINIPKGESVIKITCGLSGLFPIIKYNYKYY